MAGLSLASSESPQSKLTRRRVVTTAGHAAWATPIIVAATAAPAMANSGAAVMLTSTPNYTPVFNRIRVSTPITNQGTATPASMTVTVTITPAQGDLVDRDPELADNAYAFASRVNNANGSQTLTFTKVDPQIGPGTTANLRFDFYSTPNDLGARQGNVLVSPAVPTPGSATPNSSNYLSNGNPPSGAAVIVASQPSTTSPPDQIRVLINIANLGLGTATSMSVAVTLTPIIGGLVDADPTMNTTKYTFVDRSTGAGGVQTLNFSKVDPQIPPDGNAQLLFSFVATEVGGLKKGTISVAPSVPAPGTANVNSGDYE